MAAQLYARVCEKTKVVTELGYLLVPHHPKIIDAVWMLSAAEWLRIGKGPHMLTAL